MRKKPPIKFGGFIFYLYICTKEIIIMGTCKNCANRKYVIETEWVDNYDENVIIRNRHYTGRITCSDESIYKCFKNSNTDMGCYKESDNPGYFENLINDVNKLINEWNGKY